MLLLLFEFLLGDGYTVYGLFTPFCFLPLLFVTILSSLEAVRGANFWADC